MGEMDLIYLVFGIGLGLIGGRVARSLSAEKPTEKPVASPAPPASHRIEPSDLKPLKEELRQTQLAYQMAKEMSEFKAGFLARTSHELRSPLSSLMGMHQLILSDLCDSPEEEREFVAQANVSAQKMVKLLDEVIAVAKTEHGTNHLESRSLPLTKMFEELHRLTHMQAANRNLRLSVIPPEQEIHVLADPRRFRQVLVGLVDTAIAQLEDGSIWVSAASSPNSQEVYIWLDVECPNHVWSEAVDLLAEVPEVVNLERDSAISPGLTLLMVQNLVDVMQGHLEVLAAPEDSQDNLTRLQCSMPLATPEMEEQALVES